MDFCHPPWCIYIDPTFQRKKIYILLAGIVAVINSTLGSSLPSNAINYIAPYFHVTDEQQLVLPISLFLVGYVLGPLIFGPLSETYGRRIIMLSSFVVFTLFTMACALAPNWPAFLVFRLICGINASSAIAVVGGLYADVFGNPVIRGRAMAIFMAVSWQTRTDSPRKLTRTSGHDVRSYVGSSNIRLCLRRFLAVDVLGRLDSRWSLARLPQSPPRDLRSNHPEEESKPHAEGVCKP